MPRPVSAKDSSTQSGRSRVVMVIVPGPSMACWALHKMFMR